MSVRLSDSGLKYESSGRLLGEFSSPAIGAFLLGDMWGVVGEDATRRDELADYMIGMWRRFKDRD